MKIWLLSCLMLGFALAEKDAVQMGPGDCISTWRSEGSSHCMVKTQCSQYATKLASYQLRLVCVGHDGGRILHSFQEGGFDTQDIQETFDTNIACQRCESGESLVTPTVPTVPTSTDRGADAGAEALAAEAVNASEVHGLEEEVKQLKSSMINMAKVVTQLKLQVDSQSTQQLRGTVPVAPHVMMASAVPVAPHVVPSHQQQQVMNTSVVLATSPGHVPAAPKLPPLSAPKVQGSLSRAAAMPAMPAPRKAHGTSFLGMTMNTSAFKASVDSAGREAEEAALEAEKEAETLAAAVTSDAAVPGAIEHVLKDALAAEVH